MSFSSIPVRGPGPVSPDWWNALRIAGMAIESSQLSATIANNQSSPANVTGMAIDSVISTSAKIQAEISRLTGTNEALARGTISLIWRRLSSTWDIVTEWQGDDPGLTLTVTTTGTVAQVQYASTNISGSGYSGTLKFKMDQMSV